MGYGLKALVCVLPRTMQLSPATNFQRLFGEALGYSSPGFRRNNKKLHWTPGGEHLGEDSREWLQRHQEKVQSKLERKVAGKMRTIYAEPACGDAPASARSTTGESSTLTNGVLQQLASTGGVTRMPPLTERGTEPQVLIFEMDVLAERYRATLWDSSLCTVARPGLIEAGRQLRERFLLCAISRASKPDALDLLAALNERGLAFDYSFVVPPPSGRGRAAAAGASPLLDEQSMAVLRDAMGMTVASMERRLLAVVSVELEEAELDARLPASPNAVCHRSQQRRGTGRAGQSTTQTTAGLLSSASGPDRPHVRLWLPNVTTLLVPHARVQEYERAASATLIADVILRVHQQATRDWSAAHAAAAVSPSMTSGAGGDVGDGIGMVHACSPPLRGMGGASPRAVGITPRRGADGATVSLRPRASARAASPRTVARSSLFEQCQLGGLQRVLIGAAELARCGLLGGPCRTAITETTSSCDSGLPNIGLALAQAARDSGDRSDAEGSSAFESGLKRNTNAPLGRDAKVFVLSVQRMRRKRRERSKATLSNATPLSPSSSAAGNGATAAHSTPDGADDPLSVAPFEVWSVDDAAAPPGAPKGGVIERAAKSKAQHKGRARKGRNAHS